MSRMRFPPSRNLGGEAGGGALADHIRHSAERGPFGEPTANLKTNLLRAILGAFRLMGPSCATTFYLVSPEGDQRTPTLCLLVS
jgi:hypothetical protein